MHRERNTQKEKERLNIKIKHEKGGKKQSLIRGGHSHDPKQEVRVGQTEKKRETEKENMSKRGVKNAEKITLAKRARQTGGKRQKLQIMKSSLNRDRFGEKQTSGEMT